MFDVGYLDIVIARNCQLNCRGCITFSDHNLSKGYVKVEDAIPWLEIWSKRINPGTLHLFGGEPLMHPDLLNWVKITSKFFKKTIDIQTNGIKLSSLNYDELSQMILNHNVNFAISIHSNEDWYKEKIDQAIKVVTSIIGPGTWQQINKNTKLYKGLKSHTITLNSATTLPWVSHYKGFEHSLQPGNNYDSEHYIASHDYCEAKEFVQLYNGVLYKCPPLAVLKETLSKYNHTNNPIWNPWLNYKPLDTNCSDEELKTWLQIQTKPERYCNMCFGGHGDKNLHQLKVKLTHDH